jgi:hypothetical protein
MNEIAPLADTPPTAPVTAPPERTPLPQTMLDRIGKAMADAIREIGQNPVEKKGENTFHHYRYARIEEIMGAVNAALSKHGIIVFQSECERGFLDKGAVVYVTYEFTIWHSSGQVWPKVERSTGQSRTRDSKGGYDDKSILKCHTQARKAFLMSTFQIPTIEEGTRRPAASKDTPMQEPTQVLGVDPTKPAELVNAGNWSIWGQQFTAITNSPSMTIDLFEEWVTANAKLIDQMKVEKPKFYNRILDLIQQRRLELMPAEDTVWPDETPADEQAK